jgi:hypothetical protein
MGRDHQATIAARAARRGATHSQKMARKAAERDRAHARHLATYRSTVRPNTGGSNSIWPKGKVAKPGRMA